MIRGLINRVVAGAVAAAAAFVAIIALGATVFYGLCLVLVPLGAAAATAGIFAVIAGIAYMTFSKKADGDDDSDVEDEDEPDSMVGRVLHMVQQRPVIAVVAALGAGAVLLRKPGLAALALTAFNESGHKDSRSGQRRHGSSPRPRP